MIYPCDQFQLHRITELRKVPGIIQTISPAYYPLPTVSKLLSWGLVCFDILAYIGILKNQLVIQPSPSPQTMGGFHRVCHHTQPYTLGLQMCIKALHPKGHTEPTQPAFKENSEVKCQAPS